jgi:ubiquinone/menaquinone biosynthesis C-methylase UbiE
LRYAELNKLLGNPDLHLLDQILKGRYEPHMRVLDAGCGEGRNLLYFVRNNFDVWGVDTNATALRLLRLQGKAWSPAFDPEKFIRSNVAELPFPSAAFDAIVCCAVLHFAHDEAHFFRMTDELLRVLKPSGSLFIRTNASPGENPVPSKAIGSQPLGPDAETRFLLTPHLVDQLTQHYPLTWLEPMRTELVAGERAQATLVLQKN